MKTIQHNVEFCVVGGGLAGLCAAVAAARRGVKTLLMQERPVLGGNCSSEIRMWVCGADGCPESGLIEEFLLENLYRNPGAGPAVWDTILYEKARYQENLELLLNCSCCDAKMDGDRIHSVKGWQMTTQTFHEVQSTYFADCSGDSILAPLSGAEYRMGREGQREFDESSAPETPDSHTMGMSCLMQVRETAEKQEFIAPEWAYRYESDEELKGRGHLLDFYQNFWYIELGGDGDSIGDTEKLRDELLKITYGVWDHIKNRGDHGADNWALDWIGFLPGKRESRRYVGDYMVIQSDLADGKKFDDAVAFGGWPMDNHPPKGFFHDGEPNSYYSVHVPYQIPFRALYSKNIANLLFAGRNISVSHAALTSTRVMATCALLGQAVGTAVAVAKQYALTPRGVAESKISLLQRYLMLDDSFLPGIRRMPDPVTRTAELKSSGGDCERLRNGEERGDNAWSAALGDWAEYTFFAPVSGCVRLVFDSNLEREIRLNIVANYPLEQQKLQIPDALVKAFSLTAERSDGSCFVVAKETRNRRRLYQCRLPEEVCKLRLTIEESWGRKEVNIYAFELVSDKEI